MPTGTFTSGQFIGSRMNSLAGNPALVYVKEFSTSGTTNPQFTDCFNGGATSYQVVMKLGSSTNGNFQLKFLRNTTALGNVHAHARVNIFYATGIASVGNLGQAQFNLVNHAGITQSFIMLTIHNPMDATKTTTVEIMAEGGGSSFTWGSGRTATTDAVNGFQLTNDGGGTVNGSVYVYYIRN